MTSRLFRLIRRCWAALAVVVAMLALPAFAPAHAVLESSTPTRGAVLKEAPKEVTFEFNEAVEASFGAVRVFDTDGNQVQTGELFRPGGLNQDIGASLPADLGDGVYTATYRVVSADGHPVSGGFVFSVGKGGAATKTISELIAQNDVGKVTKAGFWLDRWVGYLAIALAVGSLVFLMGLWGPIRNRRRDLLVAGTRDTGRRAMLIVGGSVVTGFCASVLALAFQGATAAGTDFWTALKPDVMREVFDTRYGTVMAVRAGAWLALVPLVLMIPRIVRRENPGPGLLAILLALPAVVLLLTPSLAGHASTQDPTWLLLPSDIIHVAAMSVWAGGLAALVWILPVATRKIESPSDRTVVLTDFLLRFSAVALLAVILIGLSGTIQAIVEVNSFSALLDTAFGRAVLIKIILFAVLVALGAMNRKRLIPMLVARRDRRESPGGPGNEARRNLRIEVLLVSVVLAVTAALVSYPPPTAALSGPVSGSVAAGRDRLEYTIEPARVGSNEVHVYLFNDRSGAPAEIQSLEMAFSLPESDIAPIEADVRKAGPGHYVVPSAQLGVKGTWQAEAAVRLSRFNEVQATFEVPVR